MQITKPVMDDLPAICALYQTVIADMHARELYQWHWGQYPYEALLKEDIELGRLYRIDDEQGMAGRVCPGGWRRGAGVSGSELADGRPSRMPAPYCCAA